MAKEKKVSIKDIALKMNVSLSTVNKALTGKSGISEKRRQEILAVCRDMGYELNSVAQSLARNPMTIGVIMPDVWGDYFTPIKDGIDKEFENLKNHKIKASYYYISEKDQFDSKNITRWIKEEEIKAFILCASAHSSMAAIEEVLEKSSLPVFQVGEERKIKNVVTNVSSDSQMAGSLAGDFLLCLNKKIKAAVFTGFLDVPTHKNKVLAFEKRLSAAGGVVSEIIETHDREDEAKKAIEKLFSEKKDINSIYVSTLTSQSVCRYIEENNISDKVFLIVTDLSPEITEAMKKGVVSATIFQNQGEMGRIIVKSVCDYLIKKSSYGHEDWDPQKNISVPSVLYLRSNIE